MSQSTSSLIEISDPADDRYSTLRLIDWWDQERLQRACVLVVGAGALGNEVLKNLALLGVGRVIVVDMDRIEASNLSRSLLYRREDAGRPKAEVAARRVRELNPDVEATFIDGDVMCDVGLGLYRRVDLVLGCLDNREARLAVNRAAWRATRPLIDGALDVLMGSVRTFVPPDGACFECTMTDQDYALMNLRYACPRLGAEAIVSGRVPTTPTIAAIIGGMMVEEAVKLLHGLEVQAGKTLYYNGHTRSCMLIAIPRRNDCASHETITDVLALDAGPSELTLGALLDHAAALAGEPVVLLPDQPVVVGFHCPGCGRRELVLRPFDSVIPSAVPCPACAVARIPTTATRLGSVPEGRDLPLASLGIPALAVLRLEARSGRRLYLELSRDERLLFGTKANPTEVTP